MFSLKQTLADIASGLPADFDASEGIASLFPPHYVGSIKILSNYHFLYTDSLHAEGVTCPFTIDIWGSGKWHFFGRPNNGDILDGNYTIGFSCNLVHSGTCHGYVVTGSVGAENSTNFDQSGSDTWIRDNWPDAFASGINANLSVNENLPWQQIFQVLVPLLIIATFVFFGGSPMYQKDSNGNWHRVQ
jgi:hypothetical protein